jgi:hypothetical protein
VAPVSMPARPQGPAARIGPSHDRVPDAWLQLDLLRAEARPVHCALNSGTRSARAKNCSRSATVRTSAVHHPYWHTRSRSPSLLSEVPVRWTSSTVHPPGARHRIPSATPASCRRSEGTFVGSRGGRVLSPRLKSATVLPLRVADPTWSTYRNSGGAGFRRNRRALTHSATLDGVIVRTLTWLAGLTLIAVGVLSLSLSGLVMRTGSWWQGTLQAIGVGFVVGGIVDVLAISTLSQSSNALQRRLNKEVADIISRDKQAHDPMASEMSSEQAGRCLMYRWHLLDAGQRGELMQIAERGGWAPVEHNPKSEAG